MAVVKARSESESDSEEASAAESAEMERLTPAIASSGGIDAQEGLLVHSVEKGSLAEQAGMREKDVITAVGATPLAGNLDFELALFKVRNLPSVPLTIERNDGETLTLELPLQSPEPAGKAGKQAGKRTTPLRKGRIESTTSPL